MKTPHLVFLYLTRRCRQRCRHCYLSCGEAFSEELNTAQVLSLIRDLAKAGVRRLNLDGGDVFLREDLEEIVFCAADLGLKVSLVASAPLADVNRLLAIGDRLHAVSFSLDGATPGTHDWLRCQNGAFYRTIEVLSQLLPVFRVRVWCTTHARNFTEASALVDLLAKLGPPEILSFFSVSPVGRAAHNWSQLTMTSDQISAHLECVRRLSETYPWVSYEVGYLPQFIHQQVNRDLMPCNCYRRECAYISPTGYLHYCSLLLADDTLAIADLTQRPFRDVLTDETLWYNIVKSKTPSTICPAWPVSLKQSFWVPVCSQTFYGHSRQIPTVEAST